MIFVPSVGKFPAKHYASALKKAQNSKWAYKHVHNGIKHFKANNKIEAFQCLNQALNIDPLNVEGLVARGNHRRRFTLSILDSLISLLCRFQYLELSFCYESIVFHILPKIYAMHARGIYFEIWGGEDYKKNDCY